MNKFKKRLVLHIGTHKTGTTSLQDTLSTASDNLFSEGINYPKLDHTINFYAMFPEKLDEVIQLLVNRRAKVKLEDQKEYWTNYFTHNQCSTMILSSEYLSRLDEEGVRKLKSFVTPFFDEVKIIIYVRHFNDLIPSMVQQSVKLWGSGRSLIEQFNYYKSIESPLLYTKCLNNWIQSFGVENIIIRPFNKEIFKNKDLIEDFFESIGYGELNITNLIRKSSNESIGKDSLTLISEFNKKYPAIVDGKLNFGRGMVEYGTPIAIFSKLTEKKPKFQLKVNVDEARLLNDEITYINKFLMADHKFEYIEASNEEIEIQKIGDIPPDYYLDVLNEAYKEIEKRIKGYEFYEHLFKLSELDKSIFIWGAGLGGIEAKNLLNKLNLDIVGFLDNDMQKQGKQLDKYMIYNPQKILSEFNYEKNIILVSSVYYEEIKKVLTSFGLKEKEHFIVNYSLSPVY